MTTLPDALASALPSRERRSPGLELEDGRWLAAAKSGLYVFGTEASNNEGMPTPEVFPWSGWTRHARPWRDAERATRRISCVIRANS